MKNLTPLISLLFILFSLNAVGQSISIEEAIEQNKVECKVAGSWDYNDPVLFLDANGQYFGKCMTITIRNKQSEAFEIMIENGLMLMSEDTTVQNMVVTKPSFVFLEPRQRKTFELYAMCSEIHDAMPSKYIKYRVGKKARKELVKITEVINEMFMHNIPGQGAVWAFTDNAGEDDLRKYGATDASLEITKEILNRANVFTSLNPEPKMEPVVTDSTFNKEGQLLSGTMEGKGIMIQWLYVYIIAGSFVLLLLYGTYLTIRTIRNRKK